MNREGFIIKALDEILNEIKSGDVNNRSAVNKKAIYWILALLAADLEFLWITKQQDTLLKALGEKDANREAS